MNDRKTDTLLLAKKLTKFTNKKSSYLKITNIENLKAEGLPLIALGKPISKLFNKAIS